MTDQEKRLIPKPYVCTIAKRFTFDAAHYLSRLPGNHKCARMHGHTYEVEIVLVGPVDERTGMIVDYAELETAYRERVHQPLDHQLLNTVTGLENPTTEVLVRWIIAKIANHPALRGPTVQQAYWKLKKEEVFSVETTFLQRVRVKESSSTWCEADVDKDAAGLVPWCIADIYAHGGPGRDS